MCKASTTYHYQARILSVHCESDDCDGVTNTTVEATFDVKIDAINCTNEEFSRHFFNVFGIGQLEHSNTLCLFFDRPNLKPDEIVTISGFTSFHAMLDREIDEASQSIDQMRLKFLSEHQLPPYGERQPELYDDGFDDDGLEDWVLYDSNTHQVFL